MISLEEIVVFTMSKSIFNTNYISFEEAKEDTTAIPICGLAMIADCKY